MKTLPSTVTTELAKQAIRPINLYEIDLPTTDTALNVKTVRFAEYDQDVHFDGNLYTAYPITHDTIRVGLERGVDSVRVSAGVVDDYVMLLIFNNDGLRNAKVTILTVFEGLLDDPENKIIGFEGYVSHAQATEDVAVIEVLSKFDVQDIKLPRRFYMRNRCLWIYKDTNTCGYIGPLGTCDKTLNGVNGCIAHNNESRFGGFPNIPEKRSSLP